MIVGLIESNFTISKKSDGKMAMAKLCVQNHRIMTA